MKIKTKKSITKRFKLSHPKKGESKVSFESQGFAHNAGKKRKFRLFRGKGDKILGNDAQIKKVVKSLS